MIKNLIMLVIVALIGWMAYATFFGDKKDKDLRDDLINKAMGFGKSIGNIFSHESDKFEKGAYNDALDKMSEALNGLKQTSEDVEDVNEAKKYADRVMKLKEDKERLEKMIAQLEEQEANGSAGRRAASGIDKGDVDKLGLELEKEIESLGKDMKKAKMK
ncbi:MAG: hypothetical protein MK212_05790 [Saprospiraceae bacterium]|nr:hypothetical protein [Saprospiraceae bacterium]